MRKLEIKKVLDLIQTLKEVNDEIIKLKSKHELEQFIDEVKDFVNATIGYVVDIAKNENLTTISLLKDYLLLLSELVESDNIKKSLKSVRYQAKLIEISAKKELKPSKLEVLFLPYKYSMSDSLESIWQAAINDENCSVKICPIPWYEKNEDGSLGTMHYDGDLYDKNLPLVNWQEYDFEFNRPDVIFVHNPYDLYNKVTSVHPFFFGANLKKYTDCLVFVPYFVCFDYLNESLIEVIINYPADIFVVQSESVKNRYLNFLKKHNTYSAIKNKVVALGSAKFDKVINSERADFTLPDSWKNIIGNKRIILYNTSLDAFLKMPEKYICHLRDIVEEFGDSQNTVLWWRPHPLFESTLKSMHPRLLGEYQKIVSEFKTKCNGIFDDTEDMNRAIEYSDAYYGDSGSLYALYMLTGKPYELQDLDYKYPFSGAGMKLLFAFSCYKNTLYYFAYSRNALFKVDLKTFDTEFISSIPNKPCFGMEGRYHNLKIINDKIYLVPYADNDISVYDLKSSEWTAYKPELKSEHMVANNLNFNNCIIRDNRIILLPIKYTAIVEYNFSDNETIHCLDLKEAFPELGEGEAKLLFREYEYLNEDTILIPCIHTNSVLEFNLDSYSYKVHNIGERDDQFCTAVKYNNYIYLVLLNKPMIYKWEYGKGIVDKFTDFPKGCSLSAGKNKYFGRNQCICYKNYLYLFPLYANMVCRVNLDSGEIIKLEEFDKYLTQKENANVPYFDGSCIEDNKVYLWQTDLLLLEYNLDSREIRECDSLFAFSNDDMRKLSYEFLNSIEYEKNSDKISFDIANKGCAGQAIYEYVKIEIIS